jgi:hypothetical protein
LGERHDLLALGPVEFQARARLLVDADDLVPGAGGKGSEVALLTLTGLIGSRDPAVDRRPLSQLSSPELEAGKPLVQLATASYQTA